MKNRPKTFSLLVGRRRSPANSCVTTSFAESKMPTATLAKSKPTIVAAPVHKNAEALWSAETTIPERLQAIHKLSRPANLRTRERIRFHIGFIGGLASF
ncbi:hypothetical protein [Methylocella sp.]|uniref:hypothetical protein n=1 Tax=Methylocella sp. TaxID=1978226 RepID=UPI003C295FD4